MIQFAIGEDGKCRNYVWKKLTVESVSTCIIMNRKRVVMGKNFDKISFANNPFIDNFAISYKVK